jgi:hypothetical protein
VDIGSYRLLISRLRTLQITQPYQISVLAFLILFAGDSSSSQNCSEMFDRLIDRLDRQFGLDDFIDTLSEMSAFCNKNMQVIVAKR